MTRTKSMYLALLAVLLTPMAANAVPIAINFSFVDDASDFPWISRSHVPGTVSGILFGLDDNGTGQTPTSIQFTFDVSPLGMTSSFVSSFTSFVGAGFDIAGGIVTAVDLQLNFLDPTVGGMQIRFNSFSACCSPLGANVLHWNGGSGPVVGMGNVDNGFTGATYSSASVPEPGTLALLGLGLFGMGLARRKKI